VTARGSAGRPPGADECLVVRAGPLTTVQDLGRPGYAHLGVPRAGALDAAAAAAANRLVGNPVDAAVLEATALGVALRFGGDRWVAVTGATAELRAGGRPAAWGGPVQVRAGELLEVGRAVQGLRSYLAVGGGIAVPPVLGSRSRDLLSGTGPAQLADGQRLPLGPPAGPPAALDTGSQPVPAAEPVLAATPGPRADWVEAESLQTLFRDAFVVTTASNRVAVRLAGPRLRLRGRGELPSEGTVSGAVQVPPDGQPLIFLADHPTTVGYPVVAVVRAGSLSACAQLRPGQRVRFVRR
jgi:biotin-dependent carboxylase-like uncharacterized protein